MGRISGLFMVIIVGIGMPQIGFVNGWGKEGHYITCSIAQSLLTDEANTAIREILPSYADGQLAPLCGWPDTIRRTKEFCWSGCLHFINTPDFQCNYNHKRDCHGRHGDPEMCVAGGIANFTAQLATYGMKGQSQYNLTVSLLFLAHLIGDIHQPLHVGYTGDEGGNTIEVNWYKRKENLHHVWDSSIIDTSINRYFNRDIDVMVDNLVKNVTDNWDYASKWEYCQSSEIACPDAYARESIKAACQWAYKDVSEGATLGDGYFLTRLPVVEEQLSKGGVRLSNILNQALGQRNQLDIIPI